MRDARLHQKLVAETHQIVVTCDEGFEPFVARVAFNPLVLDRVILVRGDCPDAVGR